MLKQRLPPLQTLTSENPAINWPGRGSSMAVLEYSPGLLGFNMAIETNDNTARVITTDHVVRVTLTDGTDYQLRATKDEDGVLRLQTKLSREALGLPPVETQD